MAEDEFRSLPLWRYVGMENIDMENCRAFLLKNSQL